MGLKEIKEIVAAVTIGVGTVLVKIWMEVSKERLAENFAALRRMVEGGDATALLAVVKANAYGHGIDPCAAVLAKAGAEWLGVTDAQEGARVRRLLAEAGIKREAQPKVLVMCGTAGLAGEAEMVVGEELATVAWTLHQLRALGAAARAVDSVAAIHLEIESGMSRQGVRPGADLAAALDLVAEDAGLRLEGVMTHFASTEVAGSAQTAMQQKSFEEAIGQVAAKGLRPEWVHAGNSSYIDDVGAGSASSAAADWVRQQARRVGARAMIRSGLGLYGYLLPIEGEGVSQAGNAVRPVMTWKTWVIGMSEVPAGALIGYGGTFEAKRPMRLALLPVGYADGLRRELSGTETKPGGWVILRGQRADIVGRVSMNLTSVDVSGIEGVEEGEEVVLLGDGITADDQARIAGTIAYEILCGVKRS